MSKGLRVVDEVWHPDGDRREFHIEIPGIDYLERLTPKMSRQAARMALDNRDHSATVWNDEENCGYRLYKHSARKVWGP